MIELRKKLYQKIRSAQYTLPSSGFSDGAADHIARLLVVDPAKRLDIRGIQAHPWFRGNHSTTITNSITVSSSNTSSTPASGSCSSFSPSPSTTTCSCYPALDAGGEAIPSENGDDDDGGGGVVVDDDEAIAMMEMEL